MKLTNGWGIASQMGCASQHHYIRYVDNRLVAEIVQWMPNLPTIWYTANKHRITILFKPDQGIDVPDHIETCEQAMEYANALHRLGETE